MSDELSAWEHLDDTALVTSGEFARHFGVNPKTVARWADSGRLTPIGTGGGHRRYSVAPIRQGLQARHPTAAGDQLLEPRQVARLLGVTSHTLIRWAASGRLDPLTTHPDGAASPVRARGHRGESPSTTV